MLPRRAIVSSARTRVAPAVAPASSRRAPQHEPALPRPQFPLLGPPTKKARKPRAGCEIENNELRRHVAALDRLRVWSSPYAQEHDTLFRATMPEDVVNRTYAVIAASWAEGSLGSYAAGLLRYQQFCDYCKTSERDRMPASHLLLSSFISHYVGTVGGGTVKLWMSGVKAWHDLNGAKWEGEDRWIELARRTANKEGTAFKKDQRPPVTIEHMVALRAMLDLSNPLDAAVWAIATAAFRGCRRLGELTIPSLAKFKAKYHATRSSHRRRVRTSTARGTTVKLPWTKAKRELGGLLTLTTRDDDLCPEKALENHLLVNANVAEDAPLFAYDTGNGTWEAPTKDWFMQHCCAIWKAANLLLVLGHGFRIGGSTKLLLAGVPCEVVAALGEWSSLAFLLYWRKIEHIVPMNIGKAYDKKKLDEVAKAFEAFRIANGITVVNADEI
ncbi:hypothetical protein DFH06DRAFT_1018882 [Mycena polygramma]|nr:hypothetical protein DFH06DRAFT_1018882 [Mycena polygramma]